MWQKHMRIMPSEEKFDNNVAVCLIYLTMVFHIFDHGVSYIWPWCFICLTEGVAVCFKCLTVVLLCVSNVWPLCCCVLHMFNGRCCCVLHMFNGRCCCVLHMIDRCVAVCYIWLTVVLLCVTYDWPLCCCVFHMFDGRCCCVLHMIDRCVAVCYICLTEGVAVCYIWLTVVLLCVSGPGQVPPDVRRARRGGGAEGADRRAYRAQRPARVRERHPSRRRQPRDPRQAGPA